MKKIRVTLILAVLAFGLFSCGKTDKILVRHDGKWNVDKITITTTVSGFSSTSTENDFGVMTFKDNGTGTLEYSDGSPTDSFTWSVNNDNDVITLKIGSDDPVDYDILSSDKDTQHWSGSYTTIVVGITTMYDVDIQLSSLN